jgi:hypothetical protein
VRKCIGRHASGTRRLFTERLPALVAPSARKTNRLTTALQAIGLALGGQAGAQLAARLRLAVRAATLLRLGRAAPPSPPPVLHAGGVAEWAWRRGHRYGPILVDRLGRSAVSSPGGYVRAKPDTPRRPRRRHLLARRGRPPGRGHSPWCARPRRAHPRPRPLATSAAQWRPASRGRMG